MNCVETKNNIEAFIDGELGGALKDAVENHLRICRACEETKDEMILLSGFLQTSEIKLPSAALENRLMQSFRQRQQPEKVSSWRQIIFGAVAIPKPIFGALLLAAIAASWLAFEVGKINSSTVSMTAPAIDSSAGQVQMTGETVTKTVIVEVPVVKEKIVTRTIFVREKPENQSGKAQPAAASKSNILPSSSSVADNGYFTDVNLKGFQPSAEIGAKIIKEVKEDEK